MSLRAAVPRCRGRDRRPAKDRVDALARHIHDDGGLACAVEADVTDQDQVQNVVAKALDHFGRLDTVINNAGLMLLGPIEDAPTEEWERMIDINLKGLLYVAHAALPHLLQATEQAPRHVADIVNISSVAGRIARKNSGVYNLTKHGVGAFSESLRQEVTGRHVRVSLVEPGAVDTELPDRNRPEIQELLLGRIGDIERLESEDIADAIAYIVTRPRRTSINELLIRPTEQTG